MENKKQTLIQMGKAARQAAKVLRKASETEKNQALLAMADALIARQDEIIHANQLDLEAGAANGLSSALLERLSLNQQRILAMADGLQQIAKLADPTMVIDKSWVNRNQLQISRRRVPLGVIGIIYESRPNVTVDATALCLKAGNAVILRGGKEALQSNQAIVAILQESLAATTLPPQVVQLIKDSSRELASQFMQMNEYVDCLIPRGGAGLIQAVMRQATIPVIETGVGNCHLYLHTAADPDKAKAILINGKTQRNSVCNAIETLVVDEAFAEEHLADFLKKLEPYSVEIRGDAKVLELYPAARLATEEDYASEFLDSILAVRVVSDYDEAINHIETYSTGHSEVIVTENYSVGQAFKADIDAAIVYVNASSRFSDGEIFGFGGEIGISTQKLHARGPMGLEALTSYKYIVEGNGQIRE